MIYLEETLNLSPAMPATLDKFVAFSEEQLVPAYQRLGADLVAAWYCDVEFFRQVTQILEFDNLAAFEAFRNSAAGDPDWKVNMTRLEELAPEKRTRLLEPVAPVFSETLHRAIEESKKTKLKAYNLAILEVIPGAMDEFVAVLTEIGSTGALPIVASLRPVTGKQNEITDVWKGSLEQTGYQTQEWFDALGLSQDWWHQLRAAAPQERVITVYTLPHSPLQ